MLLSITDFKISRNIVKMKLPLFLFVPWYSNQSWTSWEKDLPSPLLSIPGYYPHLKKGPLPRILRVEYIFFKRKKQTKVECASVFQWKGKEKYVSSSKGCVRDPFPAIFPSLYKLRQVMLVEVYETRSWEGWVGEYRNWRQTTNSEQREDQDIALMGCA